MSYISWGSGPRLICLLSIQADVGVATLTCSSGEHRKNLASAHLWAQVSVLLCVKRAIWGVWMRVARRFPISKLFVWKSVQIRESSVCHSPWWCPSSVWSSDLKAQASEKPRHRLPAPLFQQELSVTGDRLRWVPVPVLRWVPPVPQVLSGCFSSETPSSPGPPTQGRKGQYLHPHHRVKNSVWGCFLLSYIFTLGKWGEFLQNMS